MNDWDQGDFRVAVKTCDNCEHAVYNSELFACRVTHNAAKHNWVCDHWEERR
jgi:hypothetical protein